VRSPIAGSVQCVKRISGETRMCRCIAYSTPPLTTGPLVQVFTESRSERSGVVAVTDVACCTSSACRSASPPATKGTNLWLLISHFNTWDRTLRFNGQADQASILLNVDHTLDEFIKAYLKANE
jgi:hypothetical protein